MRRILSLLFTAFGRCALFFGVRKKVTWDNLTKAFPNTSEKELKSLLIRTYDNLSIVFSEFLYLRFAPRATITKGVTFRNPDVFHDARKKGSGIIVLSSHTANWEWMALGGAPQLAFPFHVVVKNIQVGFTERFLHAMRMRTGNRLINSGDVRGMFRILKNGGAIALLGDQAAPTQSVQSVFFGRAVPTFEGPARLALRTNAALLYAHLVRDNSGKYHIEFYNIDYSDLQGETPEHIAALTQRHVTLLESLIREHPEQWLWQHRRWKNV